MAAKDPPLPAPGTGFGSGFGDLERPPLPAAALRAALAPDGFDVRVVARTASTNADVAAAARDGAPEGLVVVAERQDAARGRMDRRWVSPPQAGLTFSVLLRPPAPSGWLPLLAGVAVVAALREYAGVPAELKWPNDVLIEGRKVAGILAEVAAPAIPATMGLTPVTRVQGPVNAGLGVVLGVGLNVTTRQDELPEIDPAAGAPPTSLLLCGARTTDRATLLKAVLRSLGRGYGGMLASPETLAAAYRSVCGTFGRTVRVIRPGGDVVTGVAEDVDDEGRLIVDGRPYAAGDVVHLR